MMAHVLCGACATHPKLHPGRPDAAPADTGPAAPVDGGTAVMDANMDAGVGEDDAAPEPLGRDATPTDDSGMGSGLAGLLSLTVSRGALVPAFDPQLTSYVLDVPLATDTIALTPQAESDCTIAIAGKSAASGEAWWSPSLALGENAIAITVTAPNAPARVYTVVVKRSRLPLSIEPSAADATRFGGRAAVSGDTIAISSHRDDGCALEMWVRDGETFHQQAEVKLHDLAMNPSACVFRVSLALDGDTLVLGAPIESAPGVSTPSEGSDVGGAYVLARSGQAWTQVAHLRASTPGVGDQFGESVAVSGDTIVIGAPYEDGAGGADSGAAYVFLKQPGGFVQTAHLTASNAGAGDGFGAGVAISGDTAVVSAPAEDSASQGVDGEQNDDTAADSGAAYVFERIQDSWMQRAYLKATRPDPSLAPRYGGDQFGGGDTSSGPGVAIWADRIAVGAGGEDSRATPAAIAAGVDVIGDTGAVYLFARSGEQWSYQTRLEPQFRYGGAQFGASVALWGPRLVVGAWQQGGTGAGVSEGPVMDGPARSGAAFTFVDTAAGWVSRRYLKASAPTADAWFGWSVGISEHTLVVGAPVAVSPTASRGAVYVFPRLD
jgi:hypothetical protein